MDSIWLLEFRQNAFFRLEIDTQMYSIGFYFISLNESIFIVLVTVKKKNLVIIAIVKF